MSLLADAPEVDELPPPARRMTLAEFLALPDDGVDRWLIRGELREGGMSRRNYRHSRTTAKFAQHVSNWRDASPEASGRVLDGDAGFLLPGELETTVGIDVAYIDAALAARTPEDAFLIEGAPVLAVEVVSPSDAFGAVMEKVEQYLAAGVKVVWVAEPVFKTVTAYRPDALPQLFNVADELAAEPHLPGFRARVAELFGG